MPASTTSSNGSSSVAVQLLGAFRIREHGHLRLVSAGVSRVVAYLALYEVAPRALVAGTLWPEVTQARANADLRTALWRLNQDIPGLVTTAGGLLSLTDASIDTAELEGWINAALSPPIGRDEQLMPALTTAPKELLPGWDEEWLDDPRERIRLLQQQAWESTASRLLSNGRPGEALPYALNLAQTAPLRESAHQLLVEIFLRQGNIAEALAHYDRFKSVLNRELRTDPSLAFTTLISRFAPPHYRGARR